MLPRTFTILTIAAVAVAAGWTSPASTAELLAKEGPAEHASHAVLAAAVVAWLLASRPGGRAVPLAMAGFLALVLVEEIDWGSVYGWPAVGERVAAVFGHRNMHNAARGSSYLLFALPLAAYYLARGQVAGSAGRDRSATNAGPSQPSARCSSPATCRPRGSGPRRSCSSCCCTPCCWRPGCGSRGSLAVRTDERCARQGRYFCDVAPSRAAAWRPAAGLEDQAELVPGGDRGPDDPPPAQQSMLKCAGSTVVEGRRQPRGLRLAAVDRRR
ncbi:hypothetical protein OV079_19310 [Nannocystis pusilla]|uniref:Uncharacterized protein n=1 Tax=Nannocystis pusilla TaxID=889268 RepID=A0A9X3EQS6_9BACT|nr:hypothetical protein [Nannocystis pusilla]MCY1007659.1 hypothetical protein [Nannocystis pusilla]